MGQIARRKRKGRPPKSDLSTRSPSPPPAQLRAVRRSHRRRNVRYSSFIDYDDFIDDDDFELQDREEEEALADEDDEDGVGLRRGRKVKLVVKLSGRRGLRGRRAAAESGDSGSEAGAATDGDEESGSEGRVLKKRRISCREEEEEDDDDGLEDDYGRSGEEEEDSGRKGNSKGHESPPGILSDSVSKVPLPDKKTLELILDKLQKKDIYGVYAEPVNPEELPDYHDIIEKPMDFSTVRKKLANGSYATLNEFESDVFLICTNAMQYNASDTVYHKQARNIQELGRKKFIKLRIKYERSLEENKVERSLEENKVEHRAATDNESSDRYFKSDQGVNSSPSVKKLVKKPFSRSAQEPVSSDFSGGAVPSTTGDLHCNSTSNQGGYTDRNSVDDGLLDGAAASAENLTDKAEDVYAGRGFSSKLFRRPCIQDENRRATYNMPSHPAVRSNSIFSTFEGEIRQLVAVGLQAEYSYARSLARFAGSLGPVAWNIASQRIEQSLPSECKFGRGWVVEYEPVPTPIIFTQKKSTCGFPPMAKTLPHDVFPRKEGTAFKMLPFAMKDAALCSAQDARQSAGFHGNSMGQFCSQTMKSHHIPSPGTSNQAQHQTKAVKQFELNLLPSLPHSNGDANHVPEEKVPDNSRVANPRSREAMQSSADHLQPKKSERMSSRSRETAVRSVPVRQTFPLAQFDVNGTLGKVPNGKVPKNGLDSGRTVASPCTTSGTTKMPVPPFYFPQQDQGLSDPVQIMRLMSEKAQRQQTPSSPADNQRTMQNVPSIRDGSGNIATVGSWMTIGAGGIRQLTHNAEAQKTHAIPQLQYHANPQQTTGVRGSEFPVSAGIQFQAEKNGLHFRGLVQNPAFAFNEAQFRPQGLFSPPVIPTDFYRFQQQSHWQGVDSPKPTQHRLKQDTLPPDLNIGFQSPASPVKQSPSVKVESQQPDLALQL